MGDTKPQPRSEYRVLLDRHTVYKLRERAARESMAAGANVTWQALLRQAAERAAEGSGK